MTMRPKRNPSAGFTLIEILVTFSILMVLVLLTGPPLAKFLQRSKLVGTVQQTAVTMRMARIQAIKLSTVTVVCLLPNDNPPAVTSFVDNNRNWKLDPGETVLGKITLERGITIEPSVDFSPDPYSTGRLAVFLESGGLDSKGEFRFKDGKGNKMEVYVPQASTGRIEIRKLQGTAWITAGEGGVQWTWK